MSEIKNQVAHAAHWRVMRWRVMSDIQAVPPCALKKQLMALLFTLVINLDS